MLQRCVESNLVLNSKKCHLVNQGIVLGHIVSARDIEVDKAKIDIIQSLPYPTNVREVRSFLGMQVSTVGLSRTSPRSLHPCASY